MHFGVCRRTVPNGMLFFNHEVRERQMTNKVNKERDKPRYQVKKKNTFSQIKRKREDIKKWDIKFLVRS